MNAARQLAQLRESRGQLGARALEHRRQLRDDLARPAVRKSESERRGHQSLRGTVMEIAFDAWAAPSAASTTRARDASNSAARAASASRWRASCSAQRLSVLTSIIHPDDRAEVDARVREAVEIDEPYGLEYRIVRSDGEIRWVLERGKRAVDSEGGRAHLTCRWHRRRLGRTQARCQRQR
jgi:PAS domain-containing protein